jgi:hypothetical protein
MQQGIVVGVAPESGWSEGKAEGSQEPLQLTVSFGTQ